MSLPSLLTADVKDLAKAVVSHRIERVYPAVTYVELMLTADCNLRCEYCWVTGKRSEHMNVEIVRKSIDLLARASKRAENLGILFFGGEPLLRFNLIQEAVSYGRDTLGATGKRLSFDMTTNGTLLDEAKCRYLAKHGVRYLLSLDGDRDDHDTYRRTCGGEGTFDLVFSRFGMMKSYQPWQGARVTVVPNRASKISENVRALFERGVNQFIIGPAHGAGWKKEQLEQFEESMCRTFDYYIEQKLARRHIRIVLYEQGSLENLTGKYKSVWGCGAGRSRVCVTPDGSLYGCSKIATVMGVGNGLLRLGDVWDGFTDWQARALLNDHSSRRRWRCRSCALASRCTGGCPATNYYETGNMFEPGPEACAFAGVYDRIGQYAEQRLKESGIWEGQQVAAPTENCVEECPSSGSTERSEQRKTSIAPA